MTSEPSRGAHAEFDISPDHLADCNRRGKRGKLGGFCLSFAVIASRLASHPPGCNCLEKLTEAVDERLKKIRSSYGLYFESGLQIF